jgi:hypothetical protein
MERYKQIVEIENKVQDWKTEEKGEE